MRQDVHNVLIWHLLLFHHTHSTGQVDSQDMLTHHTVSPLHHRKLERWTLAEDGVRQTHIRGPRAASHLVQPSATAGDHFCYLQTQERISQWQSRGFMQLFYIILVIIFAAKKPSSQDICMLPVPSSSKESLLPNNFHLVTRWQVWYKSDRQKYANHTTELLYAVSSICVLLHSPTHQIQWSIFQGWNWEADLGMNIILAEL